jgi:hypothetical protein
MFFVLSSGRSGSKTIATALDQFSNCVCLHHPKPELVIEATEAFYGDRQIQEVEKILQETRQPTVDGKIYGEVNLQLSLLVPSLQRLFPDARYVWLLRDGRDAVASMYYRGWYDPAQTRVADVWHKGRLLGNRTGDYSDVDWERLTRFEKCCWIWKKYNLIIEQRLSEMPAHRWKKIYLESLKRSLDDLAGFLDLQKPATVLVEKTNIAMQPVVAWREWTPEQHTQFKVVCGEAMDRWYPQWRDASGRWQQIECEKPDQPPFVERTRRFATRFGRRISRRLSRLIGWV